MFFTLEHPITRRRVTVDADDEHAIMRYALRGYRNAQLERDPFERAHAGGTSPSGWVRLSRRRARSGRRRRRSSRARHGRSREFSSRR